MKKLIADRYEVQESLGEGGRAAIVKAHDSLLGITVAIKQLHQENRPETILRFQTEAVALAKLNHRNIVKILDFARDGNSTYMVMEYLEGTNLANLIERNQSKRNRTKSNRLKVGEALELMIDICEALAHAHKQGVLHRDLKPSNIMLVPDDQGVLYAKVVDFGIARLEQREPPEGGKQPEGRKQDITGTGVGIGSPLYMSPEQITNTDVDTRADIYSFGCVMFETLRGVPPLMGETPLETAQKQLHETAPLLSHGWNGEEFPKPLIDIVAKCLRKNPDERFQSFAKLQSSLAEVLEQLTSERDDTADSTITQTLEKTEKGKDGIVPDSRTKKLKMLIPFVALIALLIAGVLPFFMMAGLPNKTEDLPNKTKDLPDDKKSQDSMFIPSLDAGYAKLVTDSSGKPRDPSSLNEPLNYVRNVMKDGDGDGDGDGAQTQNPTQTQTQTQNETETLTLTQSQSQSPTQSPTQQTSVYGGFTEIEQASATEMKALLRKTPGGIRNLVFKHSQIDVEIVSSIAGLKPTWLIIDDCRVNDWAKMSIVDLPTPLNLTLRECSDFTDVDLAHLNNLKNLKNLHLGPLPNVSNDGVLAISQIARLESLSLDSLPIDDRCIPALCRMQKLKQINLRKNNISESGVVTLLSHLKQLNHFYYASKGESESLGAAVIDAIAQSTIEVLFIDNVSITSDQLSQLCADKSLAHVTVQIPDLNSRALVALGKLPNLKVLRLLGVQNLNVEYMKLLSRLKLTALGFADSNLIDSYLKPLESMKSLQLLEVEKCDTTAKAVEDLNRLLRK